MHRENLIEIGSLIKIVKEPLPGGLYSHHYITVDVGDEVHHRVTKEMAGVEYAAVLTGLYGLFGVAEPDLA